MSMSFQEKSLWVSLVALLLAFGAYFHLVYATVLPAQVAKDVLPVHAALFIGVTIVLVAILVAGHVVIALVDRRTETDERDRSIEIKGERYGSYVLATGVFFALCTSVFTEGNAVMALVLLGSWVLAQAVAIVSQLMMHRRGY